MERNGLTESTLAEVCSLVTDGTHDTPKRVASGYPLIKAKEITGGRLDFETCDQISEEEHLEVIARSKPEFGDTLFALDWRQKAQARAQVRLAIEDELDDGLPRAYSPELYEQKCSAVFEHIFETFQQADVA